MTSHGGEKCSIPKKPEARMGINGRSSSRDRVVAARMQRMAARDAPGSHPRATEQSVALDRLVGVARAGGLVATAGWHPGGEPLVRRDHPEPDEPQDPISSRPSTLVSASLRSP